MNNVGLKMITNVDLNPTTNVDLNMITNLGINMVANAGLNMTTHVGLHMTTNLSLKGGLKSRKWAKTSNVVAFSPLAATSPVAVNSTNWAKTSNMLDIYIHWAFLMPTLLGKTSDFQITR